MRAYLPPSLLFLVSLILYTATLAPTVATIFDDALELQLAVPTLAILHPTGYPIYSLVGWLLAWLVPIGDVAWRVNWFSALAASAAVALLFLTARRLGSAVIPAFVTALVFAVGPVWWSQATLAEVYALQGFMTLLILYCLLRWDEARSDAQQNKWLAITGFCFGLGLAHHRLTLLLAPAMALFILWKMPALPLRPRAWAPALAAMLVPLVAYALLPLRAHVGSLDGSYADIGFWGWVLGGGYSTFLQENPFEVERHLGDLVELLVRQYGFIGMAAPFLGISLWLMQPRRLVLLLLIGAINLIFASRYLVLDIDVFLIPLFIIWALLISLGLTALWDAALIYGATFARRIVSGPPIMALVTILSIIGLLWPLSLLSQRLADQNRSTPPARAWGVHDYGRDLLESTDLDGVVVGILGEMTLMRYFQETQDLRPDVATIAADLDTDRLDAITKTMSAGKPTFTTRPLTGLPDRYSLDAAGPLVRISTIDQTQDQVLEHAVAMSLTPEVSLRGWQGNLRQPQSGSSLRLSLLWHVQARPQDDFKISARLIDHQGELLAQVDDYPVHNSYRPSYWRENETVLDIYDLPLNEIPSEPVTLLVILYDPEDGSEIARWQQEDLQLNLLNASG